MASDVGLLLVGAASSAGVGLLTTWLTGRQQAARSAEETARLRLQVGAESEREHERREAEDRRAAEQVNQQRLDALAEVLEPAGLALAEAMRKASALEQALKHRSPGADVSVPLDAIAPIREHHNRVELRLGTNHAGTRAYGDAIDSLRLLLSVTWQAFGDDGPHNLPQEGYETVFDYNLRLARDSRADFFQISAELIGPRLPEVPLTEARILRRQQVVEMRTSVGIDAPD